MKKLALATLLGLLLLAGSLGLFSGNSNEAKPDSSLPVMHNAKSMGFKTGMAAPGKDGVPNQEAIMAKAASMAVPFVQNVGQFNPKVKYAADLFSGRFFLTNKELVYSLLKRSKKKNARQDKHKLNAEPEKRMPGKGLAFKEFFIDKKGNKIELESNGEQQAATVVSYFRGNDPSQWRSGVASFQSVSLGQVYPGVEVKLKASGKNVEKIFYVSPQTDAAQIKIGVAGVTGLKIDKDGRLIFENNLNELAMRAPIAWQEIDGQRHEVLVGYHLIGKRVYGFTVLGDYNENFTLVIDPDLDTLLASTLLGGNGDGYAKSGGTSLALDSSGNVYLTGFTYHANFPTTFGSYSMSSDSLYGNDVFVSKLDSNLATLTASTYLGPTNDYVDDPSLVLDSSGNVFVTGATSSRNFPTSPWAYDQTFNGNKDVFISKLDGNLTSLLASTFLGGGSGEFGDSLVLDRSGNVYLTGVTWSTDFPTTPGAYDRSNNNTGIRDVFVSKLNSDLTTLLASTYLGGSNDDGGNSLALDNSGNVYLTGQTASEDFPTTPGAYDRTYNGNSQSGNGDAFVSKLNSNLTILLASTFLGGSDTDIGDSLALDNSGNLYLTGNTGSFNFPTTIGAYDRTFNEGYRDVFVSKLNENLTTLLASTFLGGSNIDEGDSLLQDNSGNIYLIGRTSSVDFPTTIGAYSRTRNGYYDAFISKLDNALTTLLASTFLGGIGGLGHDNALVLDTTGNVYVTGLTNSPNFPTTEGAFDRTITGGDVYYSGEYMYTTDEKVFISKLNGRLPDITITVNSPIGGESWIEGSSHDITWVSNASITSVNIDYSTDSGLNWTQVAANIADNDAYPLTSTISGAKINSTKAQKNSGHLLPETAGTANTHGFAWTIPSTPSTTCLVRISDTADASISDTSDSVFSILMNLDLQAERLEVKSFSIVKQYGQIQFMVGQQNAAVAEYRIMRRKGSDAFTVLRTVIPSELQNNQFQMQDKYLKKNIQYTYLVEAYNAAGQLVGHSTEKTI